MNGKETVLTNRGSIIVSERGSDLGPESSICLRSLNKGLSR